MSFNRSAKPTLWELCVKKSDAVWRSKMQAV